jgi:hypothetical protein
VSRAPAVMSATVRLDRRGSTCGTECTYYGLRGSDYDNLQLCEPGGADDFLKSGARWRDGRLPVNVSGGL